LFAHSHFRAQLGEQHLWGRNFAKASLAEKGFPQTTHTFSIVVIPVALALVLHPLEQYRGGFWLR
jgi:hypothetical protein